MPLRVPPPEIPIIKWLSPNKADQGLIEFWNTEIASYVPLDIGAAHPNTRQYTGYTLGKQAPVQGDEKWVMRVWVTPETSPEWFNWALKYSSEDNAYPIFIRTYREPKNTYTPRTKGEPLQAFYKLVLENPGSGFTPGTSPEVIFDAESDTPAIAHGVVAPDGTLTECVLDFCGDGYEGNVTFRVDAPANGNPAEGTAYIQPASAILIKEEANPYPEDSELYAQYLQVLRVYETLPGPSLLGTAIADDGKVISTSTTRGLCADIVSGEQLLGGFWIKTTKRPTDSDIVCEQIIESRPYPGNSVSSASVDGDLEVRNIHRQLKDESAITPSSSESGGFITTVEKRDRDSDLVADEITTVTRWLDKASYDISIPNLIPQWARAQIPTIVESHVLPGIASQPTLGPREFSALERQLNKELYERRVEKVPDDVVFPVMATQEQWSEEYGGHILTETITLNDSAMTADEGTFIVSSETTTLAVYTGGPPDGLFMKRTLENLDAVWPILTEYDQDPETQSLITTTYQVVDATAVVAPSIVNGVITRYKRIDQWRSLEIIETYSLPADYEEQRFAAQNFPSLWDYTTYNYSTACGPTGPIRQGFSTMVEARIAIHFATSKETITGLTLIPNTIHLVHDVIPAVLNDAGTLTYSGTCSGPISFPASDPDFTTYTGSIQGTEQLISGESVLWRAGLYKSSRLYVQML